MHFRDAFLPSYVDPSRETFRSFCCLHVFSQQLIVLQAWWFKAEQSTIPYRHAIREAVTLCRMSSHSTAPLSDGVGWFEKFNIPSSVAINMQWELPRSGKLRRPHQTHVTWRPPELVEHVPAPFNLRRKGKIFYWRFWFIKNLAKIALLASRSWCSFRF